MVPDQIRRRHLCRQASKHKLRSGIIVRMTDQQTIPPWLAEEEPFDEDQSRAQVDSVLRLLGQSPRRILELGCGGGRVLIPLAAAGHHVTGIDFDADALGRCGKRSSMYQDRVQLRHMDFLHDPWPSPQSGDAHDGGRYDAVLLLGNTLMTLTAIDDAIALFSRAADHLKHEGVFLIDDVPGCFWPELTEGNWQSGLSEDGSMQMIWHPRDTLFTIRLGASVDGESWSLRSDDRLFRLWTESLISMVASRSGLSEPKTADEHILMVMRPI
jgi:SAM-dependent methyltransferase